ncbi:MAG: hypothetical protein ED559_07050 [Phycisphaera sp.]|nr:MAG: hypothetical protein ED559_07050 [Phycisphaera sp.]
MRLVRTALLLSLFLPINAVAQEQTDPEPPQTEEPIEQELAPLGPLREVEQDLRRTYYQFFKRTRNKQMHEQGWRELERFMDDPRVYELMIELFEDKPIEMRRKLLELFVEQASEDADVVLAWVAVFNEDEELRTWAAGRLTERVGEGEPSHRIQLVIESGLTSGDDDAAIASSSLVRRFNLLKAVPYLIQAQAQPQRQDVRRGAIAQIVVGTQQAFVANLTPVVANNAVGFQPTIGIVTDGVVLRVMDAVVWTYRTQINRDLVAMTSDAWGRSTAKFGYDQKQWFDWYNNEFKPTLADNNGG